MIYLLLQCVQLNCTNMPQVTYPLHYSTHLEYVGEESLVHCALRISIRWQKRFPKGLVQFIPAEPGTYLLSHYFSRILGFFLV